MERAAKKVIPVNSIDWLASSTEEFSAVTHKDLFVKMGCTARIINSVRTWVKRTVQED